jgi:hypothetical protein
MLGLFIYLYADASALPMAIFLIWLDSGKQQNGRQWPVWNSKEVLLP